MAADRLGLFGLGAALPLVPTAYALRSSSTRVRDCVQNHGNQSQNVFGMGLLLIGVAILTGADRWLEARLTALMPDARCLGRVDDVDIENK